MTVNILFPVPTCASRAPPSKHLNASLNSTTIRWPKVQTCEYGGGGGGISHVNYNSIIISGFEGEPEKERALHPVRAWLPLGPYDLPVLVVPVVASKAMWDFFLYKPQWDYQNVDCWIFYPKQKFHNSEPFL